MLQREQRWHADRALGAGDICFAVCGNEHYISLKTKSMLMVFGVTKVSTRNQKSH